MARFILRGSILRKILLFAFGVLVCACLQTPIAWAQHAGGGGHVGGGHVGGGHVGGGGGHSAGGGHASAPHGSAPAGHGTTSGFRTSGVIVPPARFNAGSFRFRPRPIPPRPTPPRPIPIFGFPIFFGAPFFFDGAFNSFWWPSCGPFWGPGCSFSPFYGYGGYGYGYDMENNWPSYGSGGQGTTPNYTYPPYLYGRGARDLVELFFKDGTVFDVTDYWLVDGQMHFMTVDEGGTKAAEHARDFDTLDLQTTINVNTERGFKFTLRNQPLEQYLRDHRDANPQDNPNPPKN
jgi:hypothetical protein